MRFDAILDTIYTLGTLWGNLGGMSACSSNTPIAPLAVDAVVAPPGSGVFPVVTAFVNVNVIPMDSERVLLDQTVLVEGGLITALGPASRVQIPAGAVQIDGRSKYLIPGLADMHSHFLGKSGGRFGNPLPHLFSYLASGVTALRHSNAMARDQVQQMFESFKAAENLVPRIYLAGEVREFAVPEVRLDSAAAAYRASGYTFFTGPADSVLMAIHRLGLPLGAHDHALSFEQMLALGAYGGSVDHLYAFWDTLGGSWQDTLRREISVVKIPAFAAATQRAGVWVTPTLACLLQLYSNPVPSSEVQRQLVKALQDAGVGLLLGADEMKVHVELEELVRAGLTPYQALLTSTRNVARYLGLQAEAGTVNMGKRADLVLLYDNPLADIRHVREPAGVTIGGRWIDRNELDRRLLASPKTWVKEEVERSGIRKTSAWRPHLVALEALADSLETVKPSENVVYQRLVRAFTDELGAMRTVLPPEEHGLFDPVARTWMREQARTNNRDAKVAGVGVTP